MCEEKMNIPQTRLVTVPFTEALYSESNPKRVQLPAGKIVAVTIGPDSDIDSCRILGDNGKETLDLNNPVWGPFQNGAVEVWFEYQQLTSNTDASATRTIVGDEESEPKLQLKFWIDCDPAVVPQQTKRGMKRFKKTGLGNGDTWEVPTFGRERVTIAFAETAGTDASVAGVARIQKESNLVAEDASLISAFTLTGNTEQVYHVHEDILEYINFTVANAGTSVDVIIEVWDR
jgi:hypothetical protein